MAFELLRPVNCVTSWTKPQEEDDQRRDKGRCGCAAAPGWSSHPPKPMALTIHKACAGRGQDDDWEEDPAVDPGPAFLR